MRFGEYIRGLREKNGWTQPEAAARISVEQSYLSKLETGKSYPSEDVFTKLMSVYSIDISKMNSDLFSEEIEKLREIADVRSALLHQQKNQQKFMRGWLIAGLVMLMISGSAFGLGSIRTEPSVTLKYMYRSPGVIKTGESPSKYDIADFQSDVDKNNLKTSAFAFEDFLKDHGDIFVKEVEGGHRIFTKYDAKPHIPIKPMQWLSGPALMFLFGGLACFYISRRWR